MSWIDKIQNDLLIVCGDGKPYAPSWLNASKQVEYNVAEFEFPNLAGTLVKRGTPLGRKYELQLFFQGDDHLDISAAFEKSAADPRAWTLTHPFYGTLIVQPISLLFNNEDYNVSEIKGLVIETIVEGNPITTIAPEDDIAIKKKNLDNTFSAVPLKPKTSDIKRLYEINKKNFNIGIPVIKLPEEFEIYNQAFNIANAAVNNLTATPLLAMQYTIAFITKPALFTALVVTRLKLLIQQFQNLRLAIDTIGSVSGKTIYQNTAGGVISSMCYSTVVNPDKNTTALSTINNIDAITKNYNQYISDLDAMQSPNGGNPANFVPDANSLIQLNDLVNITISNLFTIALNSKKERTLIMENDTNLILLTHRVYGLDPLDTNIDELIMENNIGLNQLFQIKKGTKIVYYV